MKFKRRPDINDLIRIQIAVQAFLGQGVYGEITRIAKFFEVSRLFVYKALWQLKLLYETYEVEVNNPASPKAAIIETDKHILLLRMGRDIVHSNVFPRSSSNWGCLFIRSGIFRNGSRPTLRHCLRNDFQA